MDKRVKAKCLVCDREYNVTIDELDYIIKGKIDAVCPMCDGSHDVIEPEWDMDDPREER